MRTRLRLLLSIVQWQSMQMTNTISVLDLTQILSGAYKVPLHRPYEDGHYGNHFERLDRMPYDGPYVEQEDLVGI